MQDSELQEFLHRSVVAYEASMDKDQANTVQAQLFFLARSQAASAMAGNELLRRIYNRLGER